MKRLIIVIGFIVLAVLLPQKKTSFSEEIYGVTSENSYWFLLHRETQKEVLYKGAPGDASGSVEIRSFIVKTGIPKLRPTPLPKLAGKEYWTITDFRATDNPDTMPYFIELDIPVGDAEPFGPEPYLECDGQCNWELEGAFGLHGVGGDSTKLLPENEGSSGCVRHSDEDITFLYDLLKNEKGVRYYIEDN